MTKVYPLTPMSEVAQQTDGANDPAKLSLNELNRRTAEAGQGLDTPAQMDPLSQANDAPPSRQEFLALKGEVITLAGKLADLETARASDVETTGNQLGELQKTIDEIRVDVSGVREAVGSLAEKVTGDGK